MKIAYVIINANRHEGTARAVWEVAERVASSHEVHLWSRTADLRGGSAVKWFRVPGPSRPEVADFVSFRWYVNRQLLKHNYDIIHSAGPNTDVANVYTIQTVHPFKMANLNPLRERATVSAIRRACWNLYDSRVVAAEHAAYTSHGPLGERVFLPVSAGTRQELLACYSSAASDITAANIRVIPNAADTNVFTPENRIGFRGLIRKEVGFSEDDFVTVFSGGDWRRKGLDLLIMAIAMIQDDRVKLMIIGKDRSERDLQRLPEELGVTHKVRFLGFQSAVEKYYAAADLFVFPTSYEAFSLATIEAAASGLPILISDVSGASELIGDDKCGELIRRHPLHIAEMIMKYCKDSELMKSSSAAARKLVEDHFTWDRVASETIEAYEVLRSRRSR